MPKPSGKSTPRPYGLHFALTKLPTCTIPPILTGRDRGTAHRCSNILLLTLWCRRRREERMIPHQTCCALSGDWLRQVNRPPSLRDIVYAYSPLITSKKWRGSGYGFGMSFHCTMIRPSSGLQPITTPIDVLPYSGDDAGVPFTKSPTFILSSRFVFY